MTEGSTAIRGVHGAQPPQIDCDRVLGDYRQSVELVLQEGGRRVVELAVEQHAVLIAAAPNVDREPSHDACSVADGPTDVLEAVCVGTARSRGCPETCTGKFMSRV